MENLQNMKHFNGNNLKQNNLFKSLKNTTGGICVDNPTHNLLCENVIYIIDNNKYKKNSIYYIHNIIDGIYNNVLDVENNKNVLKVIIEKIVEKINTNIQNIKYLQTIIYIINKLSLLDKTKTNYSSYIPELNIEIQKINNPLKDNVNNYYTLMM